MFSKLAARTASVFGPIAIIVLGIHYFKYIRAPKKGNRLPGPPQLPLLGNMLDVIPDFDFIPELFRKWIEKYVRLKDVSPWCGRAFEMSRTARRFRREKFTE
jgi:hypothetical protein